MSATATDRRELRFSSLYRPFPKQQEFHDLFRLRKATYGLFGGAAGPGKTKALLMEAVRQAHLYPDVNTLLLRRTFPELEDSLLLEFRRTIPPDYYRGFNESKHIVTWHNGSITRFGSAHNEKDIEAYWGSEWLFIGYDELTKFTRYQWQFLTSRNRCKVSGSFACMAGATNPGGIGHKYVKDLFIDGPQAGRVAWDPEYNPAEYGFVPALLKDNPVYANDEAYRKKLRSLPVHLRDALLSGDWNLLSGQFYDCWDEPTTVCRPEEMGLRDWWPRWVGIDWGYEHPSAVYWFAREGADVCVYRELVQNRLTPRMLGEAIAERSIYTDERGKQQREKLSTIVLSFDAFAERTGEATIAQQIGDVLSRSGLPRPSESSRDKKGRSLFLYELLRAPRVDERTGTLEPKMQLRIGSNCVYLIECIPSLIRDEKKVEEPAKLDWDGVNPGSGDDPVDAVGMGLYDVLSAGSKPFEVTLREELADISDATSRAVHAQRLIAAHEREQQPTGRLRWMRNSR